MTHDEVVTILRNKEHPQRSETVRFLSQFLTTGVFGVCFGIHLAEESGEVRKQRVAAALAGLAKGEDKSAELVISFINSAGVSFSHSYRYFLEKLRVEKKTSG